MVTKKSGNHDRLPMYGQKGSCEAEHDSAKSEHNSSKFFENYIWLNTKEAAEYLRTTPKQLRKWVYQGKVNSYKLWKKVCDLKKLN